MNDDTILLALWRDLLTDDHFAATHLAFLMIAPRVNHPAFKRKELPDE